MEAIELVVWDTWDDDTTTRWFGTMATRTFSDTAWWNDAGDIHQRQCFTCSGRGTIPTRPLPTICPTCATRADRITEMT